MPDHDKPREDDKSTRPRPLIGLFGGKKPKNDAPPGPKPATPSKAKSGKPFDPFAYMDEKKPGTTAPDEAYNPIDERPVKPPVAAKPPGPQVELYEPPNPYKDFQGPINPVPADVDPLLLPHCEPSAPLNSKGTPIQISNVSCGPTVVQGMIKDAGGPHISEQAMVGNRTYGTMDTDVAVILEKYGAKVELHNNVGIGRIRDLLDTGHQVMVGVDTRYKGGHWVRIEGIKDGFVHYGDPFNGRSYRMRTDNFIRIMHRYNIVSATWPKGVTVPPDHGRVTPGPKRRTPKPSTPPRTGISSSAETALHKVGVKNRVQLVRHGTQMTAVVTGPNGELIEQIHYTPTSRSSTQKAARALIGAASDIGTVAMILETAGRLFFLLEAFQAIKDMTDPQRPLDLLEKYADVLQAAARAARAGDWTQVSGELVAWSQEMAKLGGPFASAGGGFIMWIEDHWLATYGAEAITGMPPDYLMWLSREYREYVRRARAELARAQGGVVEIPVEEQADDEAPPPPVVAVAKTTPIPTHTHGEPLSGMTRTQVKERIAEQTAVVEDLQKTIRDVDNWLEELRRWEEKTAPDAEKGEGWAVNTVAYIHRSRAANIELRARKERELETALDHRAEYEHYPEESFIEERMPQATFSGLTRADIQHALVQESQRVAALETAIQQSHDYIDYLRDWRRVEEATHDSPQTIVYIDAQLQAHEALLEKRRADLADAQARCVEAEVELRERVPPEPEQSEWPSPFPLLGRSSEGMPTTWLIPGLSEMTETPQVAARPSRLIEFMHGFFQSHPWAVRAAGIAALFGAIGGGAWAAIEATGDDAAPPAVAVTTTTTTGQGADAGQPAPSTSPATTVAEETTAAGQAQRSPSLSPTTTTPDAATSVTETTVTETTTPATEQPGQSSPTEEPSAEPSPTEGSPTEEPTDVPPPLVSGTYGGTPSVVVHPHDCCFHVSNNWYVLQTRDTTTQVITLRLRGMLAEYPTMEIATNIPGTGAHFTASDMEMVAGFNTLVSFSGELTYDGLFGTLTVGGDHALPGGPDEDVSVWNISFVKTGPP